MQPSSPERKVLQKAASRRRTDPDKVCCVSTDCQLSALLLLLSVLTCSGVRLCLLCPLAGGHMQVHVLVLWSQRLT